MIAVFEVAKFTQAKVAETESKPTQLELDQRLADEKFIAWVLGTGYAADHVAQSPAPESAPSPRPAGKIERVADTARRSSDKLAAGAGLLLLGILGDRG